MTQPVTVPVGLEPPATAPDHHNVDHDAVQMLPGSNIWADRDEDGQGWAVFVDRVMVGAWTEGDTYTNEHHAQTYRDKLIAQRDRVAATQRRVEVCAGLRDVADFLAQHPDVPLPNLSLHAFHYTVDGDGFRAAVEALRPLGGEVAEGAEGGKPILLLRATLGTVRLTYEVLAERVCDTEEVTVLRPVIPAWARGDHEEVRAA